ncbi:P-loop containing nucleoside triphosphate hydrolase protein [Chytridium lagenaria]|nr:P-loop containing nucleoside triphosphate hydrolase protein [Chytridium lagenaria]
MDDGIQLNFASVDTSDAVRAPREKPDNQKGSWKKRRIVSKLDTHRTKKAVTIIKTSSQGVSRTPNALRTAKTTNASSKITKKPSGPRPPRGPDGKSLNRTEERNGPKGTSFVSSIYSANPEIPTGIAGPSVDFLEKTAPRAPVKVTDPSTFEGLGLLPILRSHLDGKMGIKQPTPIQSIALKHLLSHDSRDALVQAQTGSGKTLAFLLPIVQRLIQAERDAPKDVTLNRSLGTLALVLSPTRELAKQTYGVLESLLRYNTSVQGDAGEGEDGKVDEEASKTDADRAFKHWIVPGIIIGGENPKSEKSRLRKGCNILVSTPGRLLDHLNSTKAFEVGNLRWIILDEGDLFLEYGFEQNLREILKVIDERHRVFMEQGKRPSVPSWPNTKQLVLVSATLRDNVKKLAETSLDNPLYLSAAEASNNKPAKALKDQPANNDKLYSVPTQLRQLFVTVPSKMRLVALTSTLLQLQQSSRTEFKAILFLNTCDAVDFNFHLLTQTPLSQTRGKEDPVADTKDATKDRKEGGKDRKDNVKDYKDKKNSKNEKDPSLPSYDGKEATSNLFPTTFLFKLHGNLPQPVRESAFRGFSASKRSILICTDVAARGLDMSNVTDVIQFDPPTDVRDYVHRIGRTARIGKAGQAMSFFLREQGLALKEVQVNALMNAILKVDMLNDRPGGKPRKTERSLEDRAMDLQMLFERYILADESALKLARNAFQSYIRAYATHNSAQKAIFHVKKLHLGHVAKSFGLREIPSLTNTSKNMMQKAKTQDNLGHLRKLRPEVTRRVQKKATVKNGTYDGKQIQKRPRSDESIRIEYLAKRCVESEEDNHRLAQLVEEALVEREDLEKRLNEFQNENKELNEKLRSMERMRLATLEAIQKRKEEEIGCPSPGAKPFKAPSSTPNWPELFKPPSPTFKRLPTPKSITPTCDKASSPIHHPSPKQPSPSKPPSTLDDIDISGASPEALMGSSPPRSKIFSIPLSPIQDSEDEETRLYLHRNDEADDRHTTWTAGRNGQSSGHVESWKPRQNGLNSRHVKTLTARQNGLNSRHVKTLTARQNGQSSCLVQRLSAHRNGRNLHVHVINTLHLTLNVHVILMARPSGLNSNMIVRQELWTWR